MLYTNVGMWLCSPWLCIRWLGLAAFITHFYYMTLVPTFKTQLFLKDTFVWGMCWPTTPITLFCHPCVFVLLHLVYLLLPAGLMNFLHLQHCWLMTQTDIVSLLQGQICFTQHFFFCTVVSSRPITNISRSASLRKSLNWYYFSANRRNSARY